MPKGFKVQLVLKEYSVLKGQQERQDHRGYKDRLVRAHQDPRVQPAQLARRVLLVVRVHKVLRGQVPSIVEQ